MDLVYAAARGLVGDLGLAEEVTQGVFVLVVRKGIVEPSVGWLLKATYFFWVPGGAATRAAAAAS